MMPADRFSLPTTPEQWAAVEPNETDHQVASSWSESPCYREDGTPVMANSACAASRLLERERCVRALSEWLAYRYGISPWEGTENEARRILEDAK